LLDEPTVGLDLRATQQLETLLDEHRRSGGMAIIATHIGLRVDDAQEMTLEPRVRGATS
jgi:heme exporter protein A